MKLSTVKKFDQKNRLHIPEMYMRMARINDNSIVKISVDDETHTITIEAARSKVIEEYLNKGDKQ